MKKVYQSRVVWINFIILTLSLFDTQFFQALGLADATIMIVSSILVKIVAVGNIALRFLTNQGIGNDNTAEK